MSHQNCCGATNDAFTNQYVPSTDPGYCCLIPQHDAPAVTDDRPSPGPDTACATAARRCDDPTADTTTNTVATTATTPNTRCHRRGRGSLPTSPRISRSVVTDR